MAKAKKAPLGEELDETAAEGLESTEIGEIEPVAETTSQRLPSMEEPELDELNALADRCIDAKEDKEAAAVKFSDQCDEMRLRMRDLGRKRYSRNGFSLVIEDSEKLVIKKAESRKPKNPSTKK